MTGPSSPTSPRTAPPAPEPDEHAGGNLPGRVRLELPGEVLDLLEHTEVAAARAQYEACVGEIFPRLPVEHRDAMVAGLLGWREGALERGALMHGFVSVPAGTVVQGTTFEADVSWQVVAGVVEVPLAGPELDPGALVARFLASELDPEHTYTESFPTAMGWGVGLLTTIPLTLSEAGQAIAADRGYPVRHGLALGLAAPVGGRYGLLVIGVSLDGASTVDLGSMVGYIAGRSVFEPGPAEPAQGTAWQRRSP